MKELNGYAGKMLRVDLSSGEVTEFSSSPYLPKYLGGRGLAARLYCDETVSYTHLVTIQEIIKSMEIKFSSVFKMWRTDQ